jgi:uncharacterized FAD-dependent dehydrogenase
MQKTLDIVLLPEEAANEEFIANRIYSELGLKNSDVLKIRVLKRSIDARSRRQVKVNLRVEAFVNEAVIPQRITNPEYKNVANAKPVIIIGAGPAGLFAALRFLELGFKPIVIERGKNVKDRRRDLAAINRMQTVNPESNYCFGEGGAGTYSDGKLYTRSNKRGNIQKVLESFVFHGADETILVEAHPHIGTNKLPKIITDMRECIIAHGGEVHFNTKLVGLEKQGDTLKKIIVQQGDGSPVSIETEALILATGHSARDVFELLHTNGILIEAKPFALGVRAEHPQTLIDSIQYHCDLRGDYLPPAAYSLVEQVDGRGVYSFCMCPGGIIAPCATNPGEVVTNGWSPSKRNNPFANSGIVVEIRLEDMKGFEKHGPLMAMKFQQSVEQLACKLGGSSQVVPAQRMVDFVNGKVSSTLPETSYQPGIVSTDLREVFPAFIHQSLQGAFKAFGKKMGGYYTNDAVLHAPESRTSSPVRIPRDNEHLHHPQLTNLYPCAEGAGYAGGIVSAAMDGIRVADAIAVQLKS